MLQHEDKNAKYHSRATTKPVNFHTLDRAGREAIMDERAGICNFKEHEYADKLEKLNRNGSQNYRRGDGTI